MDKSYSFSILMLVRSFDPKKEPFYSKEDGEQVLDVEVTYMNVIDTLMYLAQCIRLNITFAESLLARFCSKPTRYIGMLFNIFGYFMELF